MPEEGQPALLTRLKPNELIGLVLAVIYLLLNAAWAWLYTRFGIGAIVPFLLYWIVAISCVFGRGIDAWNEPGLSRGATMRAILAIPLLVVGAKIVDVAVSPGDRIAAAIALSQRAEEVQLAQIEAGPGRAAAIPYLQGIPDGGVKLIRHAGGDPVRLSAEEQLRLTGERIGGCASIGGDDWICGYD